MDRGISTLENSVAKPDRDVSTLKKCIAKVKRGNPKVKNASPTCIAMPQGNVGRLQSLILSKFS